MSFITLIVCFGNLVTQLDIQDEKGMTPLHNALLLSCNNIDNFITQKNVDLQDNSGRTPLMIALQKECKKEIIEKLITAANINMKIVERPRESCSCPYRYVYYKDSTPLLIALKIKYKNEIIKKLISDVNINMKDDCSKTPLVVAIGSVYSEDIVNKFITPENVNLRDRDGNTALIRALGNRYNEGMIVELITNENIEARNYEAFNIARMVVEVWGIYTEELLNRLAKPSKPKVSSIQKVFSNPLLAMIHKTAPELTEKVKNGKMDATDLFTYALIHGNLMLAINVGKSLNTDQRIQLRDAQGHSSDDKFFSTVERLVDEPSCAICLGEFSYPDQSRLTSCKHLFHKKCLKQWATISETCPTCRTPQ